MSPIDPERLVRFENAHPLPTTRKSDAIMVAFGVTPARYYQELLALMRSTEGVLLDPRLANRVRRRVEEQNERRERSRRARSA